MKRAYVEIQEGQVHYRTEGSGEPILLLHQVPTSSNEYSRIIPILARNYKVIAMDTLGYGESVPPPREYEMSDYARSVVSFLDALNIRKTSIVGHHTGAQIGIEVAAAHPERVEKLALSGCPVFTPEERDKRLSSAAQRVMVLQADGSHLVKPWQNIQKLVPEISTDLLHEVVVDIIKAGVRGEEGHVAAYKYDTQSRLPLIKCPTLVLSGSKDLFLGKLEETARLIPKSKTAVVEGGGVFLCHQKPREFAEAILAFLQDAGT